MPRYKYTARTQDGKTEFGEIEAADSETAVIILQSQKLIITSLEPAMPKRRFNVLRFWMQIASRVKSRDIVIFTRQLAALIPAKVPLVQSLRTMSKQTENQTLIVVVAAIADDVDAGTTFSRALTKYPKIFSSFYISMVKSGEVSGRLEEVLVYLADYLNRQYLLNSRAKGALIYPAFILGSLVIIGVLLLYVVVPQLTSILIESGQQLPLATRILVGLSQFVRSWGWFFLIILILGGLFIWRYVKQSAEGRYIFDSFIIKMPIFGDLLRKIYLSRFAETLSTLSSAGVSISQALEVTAEVVGNSVYRRIILEANDEVRRGGNISAVLARNTPVLPMVAQMVAIGEETGKLDVILKDIAKFFTEEVSRAFDNLVQLIEPILILVLGVGVAILVAAVLLPIYNLAQAF